MDHSIALFRGSKDEGVGWDLDLLRFGQEFHRTASGLAIRSITN